METTKEKQNKLIDEFRKEIISLENIAKAIHSKGISAGTDGTIDIRMSASQLRELAEVKNQIFNMKKRLIEWEDKVNHKELED